MAKKKAQSNGAMLDVSVGFGNINVGDKTARVGIEIDRGDMKVSLADAKLCEKRLTGKLIAKPAGVKGDQGSLPGLEDDTEFSGVFDVKGISFTGDHIKFGATFSLGSIKVAELAKFAKRAGRLIVEESGDIPETDDSDDEGDEDNDE